MAGSFTRKQAIPGESSTVSLHLCLWTAVNPDLYISHEVIIVEYCAESHGLSPDLITAPVPEGVAQCECPVVWLRCPHLAGGDGGRPEGGVVVGVACSRREGGEEVFVAFGGTQSGGRSGSWTASSTATKLD